MPEQRAKPEVDDADQESPSQVTKKPSWKRFFSRRRLMIAGGLTVILFGLAFVYSQRMAALDSFVSPEISLGGFEFESPDVETATIAAAKFNLHVSLLTEVDKKARIRFAARRFRIQQDVEELLRQARGGDFEDPQLAELKRQLQEQINATLDMRAVADVIITDLELGKGDEQQKQPEQKESSEATAASSPWKEKEAG